MTTARSTRTRVDTSVSAFGRLGDTPQRDYSRKLRLFNVLAEPELRAAIASLRLTPGMRVLDAGCGTGECVGWLAAAVAPTGLAVGVDLSTSHLASARVALESRALLVQADVQRAPLHAASFDLVWSVNTVNHLRHAQTAVGALAALLRPGGRIALGQSSFLPDMFFAWDARLERVTTEAVRAYYRDRYQLTEQDLASVRGLVGLMLEAGLTQVTARTCVIERTAPLDPCTQAWLLETVFRGTWGERLRPYLSPPDYAHLSRLCDPEHPEFALRRADFHFLQTFTLVVGACGASAAGGSG
ncbi:MAG TPA: methyltransferase domain-containing protein [Steroidobacteraceae bacterium]|nr:methyltransferase domain-containing protein [Steroidobacteraceae bacterium]